VALPFPLGVISARGLLVHCFQLLITQVLSNGILSESLKCSGFISPYCAPQMILSEQLKISILKDFFSHQMVRKSVPFSMRHA
jgi:hypothetical protein